MWDSLIVFCRVRFISAFKFDCFDICTYAITLIAAVVVIQDVEANGLKLLLHCHYERETATFGTPCVF